ncbi:MAG: hypothetical protein ABW173_00215 [Sphingomonas sp.]
MRAFLFLLPLVGFATAAVAAPGFTIGGEGFPQADIVDARAMPDVEGTATIMLTFSPTAAKRLATVTRGSIGKPLPIALDGKLLMTPVILTTVTEGVIEVGGHFPVAEAEALAKRISGKEPLPDSMDQ